MLSTARSALAAGVQRSLAKNVGRVRVLSRLVLGSLGQSVEGGPPWAEPYKIKMVEPLKVTTQDDRRAAMKEAGYNTFLLKSEDVFIDLLTDSGTGAMSDRQWAALMMGDEAYAGSANFYKLESTIREHYGYQHVIPTHQGRGAEHILSQSCIKPGDWVPGNMYFTTTRLHQELAGGEFVDVIVDEAHDASSEFRFKGNVDLDKLRALVDKVGADKVPYISVETNVNMAGGQPMSMQNIKAVAEYCRPRGIKVMLDATRACENAFFVQQYEDGYSEKTCKEILLELCSYTDGATMSGKKDSLVNIGGWLAVNDPDLAVKARNMVVVYEGLQSYGGMAGRDMEAMAQGICEAADDSHLRARIGQVTYLYDKLVAMGIPVVRPCGGHGVYIDAKAFLPHVPQEKLPAQSLAAELFVHSGVRSMERGVVSAGRDKHGNNYMPELELVRLTIPRRVYTQAHMDIVAYSVGQLYQNRQQIGGLRFTYEPKELRFFQSTFEPC